MAVEILRNDSGDTACMFCTTSMWAFGPVFQGNDAGKEAVAFLAWCLQDSLRGDPRMMSDKDLENARSYFRRLPRCHVCADAGEVTALGEDETLCENCEAEQEVTSYGG